MRRPPRPGPPAGAVQHGPQPALQLRPAGHRHGRHADRPPRAGRPGDAQQVAGVVGRRGPGQQHQVVARPLPLGPQLSGRQPRQRVEPVDGAGDVGQQLRQAVVPADVGQFVQHDHPPAAGRPVVRLGRQQQDGAEHAERHRHDRAAGGPAGGEEEADGAGEAQVAQARRGRGGATPGRRRPWPTGRGGRRRGARRRHGRGRSGRRQAKGLGMSRSQAGRRLTDPVVRGEAGGRGSRRGDRSNADPVPHGAAVGAASAAVPSRHG